MADTCVALIIFASDLAKIGEELQLQLSVRGTRWLAYNTALAILSWLPPVGRIYVRTGYTGDRFCYFFVLGKKNTPVESVPAQLLDKLSHILERKPETLTRREKSGDWTSGTVVYNISPTWMCVIINSTICLGTTV